MIQIDKPMPEGCDVCPLMYDYIQCNALPEGCEDDDAFNEEGFDWTKRPEWCPLKEQEIELQKGRYYSIVFDIGYKAGKESIIRCKDCKWFEMPRYGERGFCKNVELIRETMFYCADGERR